MIPEDIFDEVANAIDDASATGGETQEYRRRVARAAVAATLAGAYQFWVGGEAEQQIHEDVISNYASAIDISESELQMVAAKRS